MWALPTAFLVYLPFPFECLITGLCALFCARVTAVECCPLGMGIARQSVDCCVAMLLFLNYCSFFIVTVHLGVFVGVVGNRV